MSFFMQKHAIETKSLNSTRKRNGRSKKDDRNPSACRVCRIEELEKREYLAADPISVGVVYCEQQTESLGDKFYVAWVGGEDGCTTLDTLIIDLDKNQNGRLDEGEAWFDTEGEGGVYSYVPFTLVSKTDEIGYDFNVVDGGTILEISFTNFHAGDSFIFVIDVDEYQSSSTNNPLVEGSEMGGSFVRGIEGSRVFAEFSSEHYQTESWAGMFINDYDDERECERYEALDSAYDREILPYDHDDQNEGIWQAGVYGQFDLTPKPIVISGYVFADYDVDCNFDPEDDPIAGVEVTLVSESGDVWKMTTDVNGYYEFNDPNLLPGNYSVYSQENVVSPEGYVYADFCASAGDFGVRISPVQIDLSGMQGGDASPNNNFAKVLPGSISGHVFEDLNNANGKEDGEGWDGVRYPAQVELYRIDGDGYTLMQTQTVDANGFYEFIFDCSFNEAGTKRMLPGRTYEIREVFDSVDYTDGKDYLGTINGAHVGTVSNDTFSDVFVGYGEHGVNYDFGELKLGSIAGNVYEDRNVNGIFDNNEKGIAGVTIGLYQFDGSRYVKIAETQTDRDGSYEFTGLNIVYDYAVKEEEQPFGYSDGIDSAGNIYDSEGRLLKESEGLVSNDYISDVEIGWDHHGYDYNFGEVKLGSIAGNVYEDRNNNGIFDENEVGIGQVTIELYRWNGTDYDKVDETVTNEDGSYLFDNLDINEQYAVREKQPQDYADGKDAAGDIVDSNGVVLRASEGLVADDFISKVDIGWDEHGIEYNFGELKLGSISGYVYHDANDNGVYDSNEDPIANVTVELYRLVDGEYILERTTVTNDRGFYLFDNLDIEETYAVKEIQPTEWNDGKDSVGTLGGRLVESDNIDSIRVLWDQHGQQYNFGELLPVGSLSGYVYEDDNDNGLKENGEAGIPNVTVSLYVVGDDGLARFYAEQKTDSNGYYEFNNLPSEKTYVIRETQPAAYFDGKDSVGTIFGEVVGRQENNDEILGVDLPRNGVGINYNFGELKPASISGYVYEDTNENGVMDPNEPGIPNTNVTLYILNEETGEYESTGRVVATDSLGHYIFGNLQPSRIYRLVETQPINYRDGQDTPGSLGGYVPVSDVITDIPVAPGDEGILYNFGELTIGPPRIPDVPPPSPSIHIKDNLWSGSPTNFPYVYYQPIIPGSMTTLYGGGGFVDEYSWHLSTINDALPRSEKIQESSFGFRGELKQDAQALYGAIFGSSGLANVSEFRSAQTEKWILRDVLNSSVKDREFDDFGVSGIPVVGDWKGEGRDYVGIFKNGEWYLDRNGDGKWTAEDDIWANLGSMTDTPVTGDWDGDGKTDIGVFGPNWDVDPFLLSVEKGLPTDTKEYYSISASDAKESENVPIKEISETGKSIASVDSKIGPRTLQEFKKMSRVVARRSSMKEARYDLIDHVFKLGSAGDYALTGDWTGDGISKIGYVHSGKVYLDRNGNGVLDDGETADIQIPEGYIPVVGDFNGDGVDTVGYFKDGEWQLDVDGTQRLTEFHLGQEGDTPITGDWDGDGVDSIGVYRSSQTTETGSALRGPEEI